VILSSLFTCINRINYTIFETRSNKLFSYDFKDKFPVHENAGFQEFTENRNSTK